MKKSDLLGILTRGRAITMRLLEQFPKDKGDFRPRDTMRSAMQTIVHIGLTEQRFVAGISEDNWDFESIQPPLIDRIEQAVAYIGEVRNKTLAWLANTDEAALDRVIKTPRGREGTIAYFLLTLADHEAHHRGQLVVYARLCGRTLHDLFA
ncbi:MAG: DinB family protein [bacterium]